MEEYLDDYNSVSQAPMKLVMFLDAIEHVSRICRVIRLPLGNALLLGVGGSGRQSLTRLATYMEDFHLFQVSNRVLFGGEAFVFLHSIRFIVLQDFAKAAPYRLNVLFASLGDEFAARVLNGFTPLISACFAGLHLLFQVPIPSKYQVLAWRRYRLPTSNHSSLSLE
jgi:hypothetical protein